MTNVILMAAMLVTNHLSTVTNGLDCVTNGLALGGYARDPVAHTVKYSERLLSLGLLGLPEAIQASLDAITELNRIRHEQAAAISNLTLEVRRLRDEMLKPVPQPQWNPGPPIYVPLPGTFPTGFYFNGSGTIVTNYCIASNAVDVVTP